MDFQSYLKTAAAEINQELDRFFQKWSEEVEQASPKLVSLNKIFIEASEGGKRLRGSLVKLGFELTDSEYTPEILKPAAGFEIFQTAILAHDDIIDQSPLRRGKPTIYKILGGDHYAISQTICLGDSGYFLAEKLILDADFPEGRKNKALSWFIKGMLDTVLGQTLDIELPRNNQNKSRDDILTIFRFKTAMYTIIGPLSLGVILGGGPDKLLHDIAEFGESLGTAFQIQDDILGVFGNEETIGKSVTSDIEEGKLTLLFLHALENDDEAQKEILDKYYGKGKIGESELEAIRKVFIETGALESSQNKAQELVEKAKKTVEGMEIPDDKKEILLQMSDFIVKREK